MAQTAKKVTSNIDVYPIDELFLDVFLDLCADASDKVARSTQEIFDLSGKFMSKDTSDTLKQFYNLYFGTGGVDKQKERVNKEVDDLIDQIQENMASGKDVSAIKENEQSKLERLGLSGLQKQLEGLITLDEGIKNKIMPALSSMQFEDAVKQRLEHLSQGWDLVIRPQPGMLLFEAVQEVVGATLSSADEIHAYYRIVLKEEPPEVTEEKVLLFGD
jgi:hypothetical protein